MASEWRAVVGAEGFYEVSNDGSVRSRDRVDGAGRRRKGRVLRQMTTGDGHRQVTICCLGTQTTRAVHRLVLEAFVGPCPEGLEACHYDGVPSNNSLSNLRWDSRSANMLDRVRHGVHPSSRKSECLRGHRLAEPNLMPSQSKIGYRGCLACNRAHARARSAGITLTDRMAHESYAAIIAGALVVTL